MWGGRHEHGGCRKHPHYSEIGLGAFREFGSILREYNNEIKVACFIWVCRSWQPNANED